MDAAADLVFAVLGTAAALVATGVTVWTTVSALGRPARLRRDETLWRQLLETDTQDAHHGLVRNLHRHTAAQLIALRLVPSTSPVFTKIWLLLGAVLGLSLGVLGAAIGTMGPGAMIRGPGDRPWMVWAIVGGLFLSVAMMLGWTLKELADDVNARHAVTRDLLEDQPLPQAARGGLERLRRHHRRPRGVLGFKVILLSVGGTLVVAGFSGILWAFWTVLVTGTGRHLLVVGGAFLIAAVGALLTGGAWATLVEPLPKLHSSAPAEHPPERQSPAPLDQHLATAAEPSKTSPVGQGWPVAMVMVGLLAGWRLGRRSGDQT